MNRRIAKILILVILTVLAYVVVFKLWHADTSHGYKLFFLRKGMLSELKFDFIIFALLCGAGITYLIQISDKHAKFSIFLAMLLLGLILNLFIYRPTYNSWDIRLISNLTPVINPFYTKGMEIKDPFGYPRKHLEFAKGGYLNISPEKTRLTTYPPGLPLLYWSILKVDQSIPFLGNYCYKIARYHLEGFVKEGIFEIPLENQGVLGTSWLAVYFSLLAYLFLLCMGYLLTLMLSGHSSAVFTMGMLILLPSIQLFSNTSDVFFPGIALAIIFILLLGLKRSNYPLIGLSGFIMISALFFTFAFLPMILLSFLMILFYSVGENRLERKNIMNLGSWVVGMLISWTLILLLTGVNMPEMCYVALKNNRQVYTLYNRGYLLSIPLNIMEISYFIGFLPIVFFALRLFEGVKVRCKHECLGKKMNLTENFLFSFGIVFILMLLSGGARGEVGRNWLIYFPLITISAFAGDGINKLLSRKLTITMLILLVIISSITEVTFCFWI